MMSEFVRVAAESELPIGSSKEVELQGRIVALFNVGGRILALDGICPHAGGPLSEGIVEGQTVTCPWHGWQFDLATGQNVVNSKCVQRCYQVRVEGGEILLSLL
jgi:nitrite reductase/ring-hydroxylating ferredoxin subunit